MFGVITIRGPSHRMPDQDKLMGQTRTVFAGVDKSAPLWVIITPTSPNGTRAQTRRVTYVPAGTVGEGYR